MRPLQFVPVEQAVTPRDGEVITNRWWIYDPHLGIAFAEFPPHYWAPQCNRDKTIANSIRKGLTPELGLRFLEVVFLGHEGKCK